MVVKHVGPLSVGKVFFALYAFVGLLAGLAFAALGMWMSNVASSSTDNTWPLATFGAAMGIGAIIIMPIVYGVLGFIGGVIFAAFYNIVAKIMGGIEVDIS